MEGFKPWGHWGHQAWPGAGKSPAEGHFAVSLVYSLGTRDLSLPTCFESLLQHYFTVHQDSPNGGYASRAAKPLNKCWFQLVLLLVLLEDKGFSSILCLQQDIHNVNPAVHSVAMQGWRAAHCQKRHSLFKFNILPCGSGQGRGHQQGLSLLNAIEEHTKRFVQGCPLFLMVKESIASLSKTPCMEFIAFQQGTFPLLYQGMHFSGKLTLFS